MATVTAYNSGLLTLTDGSTAFATDACYAILVNGYTFSAAHTAYSDVSASELADVDYAQEALTTKTVAVDTNKIVYDCDDISFGTTVSIGPADGIVIIKGTAGAANAGDDLLFYAPFSPAVTSTSAAFSVNTTNGLYEISIA